jgi:hypothetical protein
MSVEPSQVTFAAWVEARKPTKPPISRRQAREFFMTRKDGDVEDVKGSVFVFMVMGLLWERSH